MNTAVTLFRGFLKSRKDFTNAIPAKIARVRFKGWSPMGDGPYYVILVEKVEKSRSIIIHRHWGPDRGPNADWFDVGPDGKNIVEIVTSGFIPQKVVAVCLKFIKAKEKLDEIGSDVWKVLPSSFR